MSQDERTPRIVIVGGGFAGLAAARALRKARADVVLIDKRNHHLFQPLLYQVATAGLSPGTIAAPLRKILERQRNAQIFMGEVTSIDLGAQQIEVAPDAMRYRYDYLILAAGAVTNYFGNDNWEAHAPGLKNVDDALDIRRRFLLAFEQAEFEADAEAQRAALTFVLVGGGPTGVEMAGALAEISRNTLKRSFRHFNTASARVVLLDAGERLLASMPPELGDRAKRDLEKLGVEVQLHAMVDDAFDSGVRYTQNNATHTIHANNVIWAAGVRAAKVAGTLGVETERDGRVIVEPDLSLNGHPEVFAVGDAAAMADGAGGQTPGVAQGAIQSGEHVGRLIRDELDAKRRGESAPKRDPFHYFDKGSLATIGRSKAVAHMGPALGGAKFAGFPAWVMWSLVHVAFLVGFRNKLFAMLEWSWMYLFHERGVRLITGRDATPDAVRPRADREAPIAEARA